MSLKQMGTALGTSRQNARKYMQKLNKRPLKQIRAPKMSAENREKRKLYCVRMLLRLKRSTKKVRQIGKLTPFDLKKTLSQMKSSSGFLLHRHRAHHKIRGCGLTAQWANLRYQSSYCTNSPASVHAE